MKPPPVDGATTLGSAPGADAALPPRELILHVSGLAPETDESALELLCERFGQVVAVRMPRDRGTGRSRGFGFVMFATRLVCERAFEALDGARVDGRRIRTDFAQSVQSTESFRGLASSKVGARGGGDIDMGGGCQGTHARGLSTLDLALAAAVNRVDASVRGQGQGQGGSGTRSAGTAVPSGAQKAGVAGSLTETLHSLRLKLSGKARGEASRLGEVQHVKKRRTG